MRIKQLTAGAFAVLLAAYGGDISAFEMPIMGGAGTTAGDFLRIGVGARAAAMGEAYSAVADDVYSMYWNPAGLSEVKDRQLLLTHTAWYEDVNHEYAGYVHPLANGKGALGLSATYLGTSFEKRAGDTEAADSNGSVSDVAIGAGYGRQLIWGFRGGLALKYIHSRLDTYTAGTYGIDAGLQRPSKSGKTVLGLAVTNLGGKLKYVSDKVELGQTFDLGLMVRDMFFNNLTFATDARSLFNNSNISLNAGLEYKWVSGGDWALSPRVGFKSYDSQLSYGLGFGRSLYQLDYAFVPHADMGQAHRLSLSIKFKGQ